MQKSILYFFVALTVLSVALSLVPNVRSAPADIKIVSYSWYIDLVGMVEAVGEVQNTGTNIIDKVHLGGTVTTNSGTQVDSSTLVYVNNLLPGQKAPFNMQFYIQGISVQTMQQPIILGVTNVNLIVLKADTTTGHQYPDLKITTQTHSIGTTTDDKGVYWVSGTLQNTGSQTAQNVRILGTFYNSSGNVVAVGGYTIDPLTASLSPSATINFKFGAYDVNQSEVSEVLSEYKISSYSLLIQTEGPILQGTAPTVTPYPTTNPTSPSDTTSPTSTAPSDTQTPDSGNPINSNSTGSSPPGWVYAVVVVVVLAAIVGGVVALRKRKSGEEPETDEEQPKKVTKKPATKTAPKKPTPKKPTPKKHT